jgi:hypothetical protein
MIKFAIILSIIHFVNSHGILNEPLPRRGTFIGQGCNVGWEKAYHTSKILIIFMHFYIFKSKNCKYE